MFSFKILNTKVITVVGLFLLTACSQANSDEVATPTVAKNTSIVLDVYKSPTCGCCKKWIDHLDKNGFQSKAHNRNNLAAFKQSKGIEPRYRSCHTAVSKEGYVFEGHVPAKFIEQFLLEKPEGTLGLSVPAMPMGSPGMEMGDKFTPYQVLLLKTDGTSEVYSMVNSYKEQF